MHKKVKVNFNQNLEKLTSVHIPSIGPLIYEQPKEGKINWAFSTTKATTVCAACIHAFNNTSLMEVLNINQSSD